MVSPSINLCDLWQVTFSSSQTLEPQFPHWYNYEDFCSLSHKFMSVTVQITLETVKCSIQMQEDVICWILWVHHYFVLPKRLKRWQQQRKSQYFLGNTYLSRCQHHGVRTGRNGRSRYYFNSFPPKVLVVGKVHKRENSTKKFLGISILLFILF